MDLEFQELKDEKPPNIFSMDRTPGTRVLGVSYDAAHACIAQVRGNPPVKVGKTRHSKTTQNNGKGAIGYAVLWELIGI